MYANALRKAIGNCNGQSQLAEKVNQVTDKDKYLKQFNISKWIQMGRVPSEWVLDVENASGVPCWELRPDLYPPSRFANAA
ncbi:YdaS family helix-turn-helix protein [Photobacterium sp. TLY01]|uniref:transcriptional regulator n=1 Tax=Photobacterium sp. TLY01 TaxID=2907534 RepID=UPI001F360809|nr:YdaS family helix-turn-helix protein [Photobacterium sp. TLY01]UIP28862.1 helix-turn-helix domain-containing protein [Photobacterium sp. TLY01]